MFKKKFTLIAIFLVALLAFSAVSANENTDAQSISLDDDSSDFISMDDGSYEDDSYDDEWEDDSYEDDDGDDDDDYEYDEDNTLPDDWMDPDYVGDDYYYDEFYEGTNAKLEVIQSPTDYGDDTITFRLFDIETNASLANVDLGVVTTYDWEYEKITTDSDGIAVYHIPFGYGTHGVEAGLWYIDDDESPGITETDDEIGIHCSFLRSFVNITTVPATIKLSQVGTYYNNAALKVSLRTPSNQPVKGKVKITFSNGKSVTLNTNSEGVASYSIPFAPGTYSATAKAVSDNVIANSVTLKNIKISKSSATITPTKLSTTYASGKYFQVKVVNSKTKKAISGVKLNLKVYTGKKYKTVTVTTNSKGIAKYSASTLGIGTHKVVVSLKDTKYITAKSKKSSVKVSKATLKISAPKVTNQYKQAESFKVTVKNKASGKAMSGVKVTVKVYTGSKYKTYTKKTNSKGVAAFSTKSLSKTTHKVVVKVKATKKYKAASAKSSVKIVKSKLKTKINIEECYRLSPNSYFHIKLSLKDSKNRPLANKKVTIQTDIYFVDTLAASPTTTLTTDSSGYIDTTLGVVLGGITEYNVKVSFKGDGSYKGSKASKYLY